MWVVDIHSLPVTTIIIMNKHSNIELKSNNINEVNLGFYRCEFIDFDFSNSIYFDGIFDYLLS